MTIRKADWKWLRCATLDHPGFLPGMPWMAQAFAYERLLAAGFVTRECVRSDFNDRVHVRAVATEAGREALARHGAETLRRLEEHRAAAALGLAPQAQPGE